jgi:hypothetical protein
LVKPAVRIIPRCSTSDPSETACANIGIVEASTPAKNNPITRTFGLLRKYVFSRPANNDPAADFIPNRRVCVPHSPGEQRRLSSDNTHRSFGCFLLFLGSSAARDRHG